MSAPPPRMRNGLGSGVIGSWAGGAGSGIAIIIDTINQQTIRKCAVKQCTVDSSISISVFFIHLGPINIPSFQISHGRDGEWIVISMSSLLTTFGSHIITANQDVWWESVELEFDGGNET